MNSNKNDDLVPLILLLTQQFEFIFLIVWHEAQPPEYNISVISTQLGVACPLVMENSDKLNISDRIRATFRP